MDILIATAHILGSIIAVFVFGLLTLFSLSKLDQRNHKQACEELSIALGISVEELENEEHASKIAQLSAEKFSTELFRNRISDFFGLILSMWGWLSILAQGLTVLTVIWVTVTETTDAAVNAWFMLGLAVFFSLASVIFTLTCKLLTGRYPGEAKAARKLIAGRLKFNRLANESLYD